MSPEIILLAIGCYLFCGVSEKVYRIKTGDWRKGNGEYNFEKELSEFNFVPNETTHEQVLEKFGERFIWQRSHAVIRKQNYNGKTYYVNRELLYSYTEVQKITIPVGYKYCTSALVLSIYFKDDLLEFYAVSDSRMGKRNCKEYIGPFHTITDKAWLPGGMNYPTASYNCNEKFYRIFTLYQRQEWPNAKDCDFYKDPTYWDDPVYDWRKYFPEKGDWPCGGTIFNSC